MTRQISLLLTALVLAAGAAHAKNDLPFDVTPLTSFDEPWALTFLPDGRMLVTEKMGRLYVVTQDGQKSRPISGLPNVDYGNQGGLGDVALHSDFANNGVIYISYVEGGIGDTRGAAVVRGVLELNSRGGVIADSEIIWRSPDEIQR